MFGQKKSSLLIFFSFKLTKITRLNKKKTTWIIFNMQSGLICRHDNPMSTCYYFLVECIDFARKDIGDET